MKKNKIWNYFNDSIDYPEEVVHEPIPYGVCWNYISHTFLNGLINYVKPIGVWQLDRYTHDDEIVDAPNVGRPQLSKRMVRELVMSGDFDTFQTDLSIFQDDICILAKFENNINTDNLNRFIFFYFDMDVSDCSIGKFETTDSKETVIESIFNWLDGEVESNKERSEIKPNFDGGIVRYTQLPLSFLKGWKKF